ncbi:MAG: hypothetical protein U1E73_00470 [Planctomycetota bacterium]
MSRTRIGGSTKPGPGRTGDAAGGCGRADRRACPDRRGDQAVTDLDAEAVDAEQVLDRRLLVLALLFLFGFLRRCGAALRAAALDEPGEAEQAAGDGEEQQRRHARQQRHQRQDAGDEAQRAGLAEDLRAELLAEALVGRALGHQDAGRGRHQQARDLRDEAVADRQDRVLEERVVERQVAVDHAHDQAAGDVDRGDDEAGDGVAAHELAGAVHRAVELHLRGQLAPLQLRLLAGDEAGAEVGVDRHLLARHRVEHEPRGDLADAVLALRDHHELDDHEHQEHDDADDRLAADDEAAERADDGAGVALQQDQPGRRDVEREAEQRREQQHGRERAELDRLLRIEHRHDDEQARHDVEAQQRVEQRRRHRDQHHREHAEEEDGEHAVAAGAFGGRCHVSAGWGSAGWGSAGWGSADGGHAVRCLSR